MAGKAGKKVGKLASGVVKAATDNVTVIVSRTVAEQMFLALSKALGGGGAKKKKGGKKTGGKKVAGKSSGSKKPGGKAGGKK